MWSLTIATGKLEFSTERKMEVGEALASRITLTVDTAGLLLTIAFVVSGAFLDEPILFCGHAMMQRLYAFTGEGITLRQTILWTGITSVTSVIVGARHLSKKDLIR